MLRKNNPAHRLLAFFGESGRPSLMAGLRSLCSDERSAILAGSAASTLREEVGGGGRWRARVERAVRCVGPPRAQVKIFSLPQEWLWCETWCGNTTKANAKTIDLCNNPLTKVSRMPGEGRGRRPQMAVGFRFRSRIRRRATRRPASGCNGCTGSFIGGGGQHRQALGGNHGWLDTGAVGWGCGPPAQPP